MKKKSKLVNCSFSLICKSITFSELLEKEETKTIKRRPLGGIAGGDKFIVKGILFKVAHDVYLGSNRGYLYGGADPNLELAAKAASHDLKGASQYFRCFYESNFDPSVMGWIEF